MSIAKKSRKSLRNHRKAIHVALSEYAYKACDLRGLDAGTIPIRILRSIRSTSIRIPRIIVPDEFVQMVLAENETKKYRIEFCQNHKDYIQVILHGKPLIEEGQGILFFFFRELLQHLEKMPKAARKTRLKLAVSR